MNPLTPTADTADVENDDDTWTAPPAAARRAMARSTRRGVRSTLRRLDATEEA